MSAPAARAERSGDRIAGRYIVVYEKGVGDVTTETDKRERGLGFRSELRYGRALKGFSARLSPGQVRALQADPDVAFVSPDRAVRAVGSVPLVSGESLPPTGVRRIEAATASTVRDSSGAAVAVIDTGIDLNHPDLNASEGKNCVGGTTAADDEGHGTHVAGTIAAKNDGAGVVGVAPGTKLYAAKVLDSTGSGTSSQVICGIDWVTANAARLNIKVANMSLGGAGPPVGSCATTTDPEHKAICNSVAAGVTYVVAAGNDGWDFDNALLPDTPAAFREVLTVAAVADSDGGPGGTGGAPGCRTGEMDDRYASFSNYAATSAGRDHTIAGPGVCINSTVPGGRYATLSGTSMAAPHLAGAVALCLGEGSTAGPCAGLSPGQIIQKLRNDAQAHTSSNADYGFVGDPLRPINGRYYGFLDWSGVGASSAGGGASPPPPAGAGTRPPAATTTQAPAPSQAPLVTLAPGVVADRTGPALSVPRLSVHTFQAARSGASAIRAVGTRVSFSVSERAVALFRVERAVTGRLVGGRCRAKTTTTVRRRVCTRWALLRGSFTHTAQAGANSFRYTGRLSGRSLLPGRYRLLARSNDLAGNSSLTRRVKFRIIR
jgi:subtilisin family serine protease